MTMMTLSSLSSICMAGLSGCVVCPSSFFVVAGRRVPVMWVLAVNCQWAVDHGGAVLVGWVVIGMVGLLTVCKRTNEPCCAPVVVFRGCWLSCPGHVGASRQSPVGGRPWWCCVSGVGGNRHGGAAYRMQKDE